MEGIRLEVGDNVAFRKTIGETDVYMFAGITGDLSPNHVDEAYMATTPYGGRIAHGVLILGFASTTSTKIVELDRARGGTMICVSLGYDRVRFLKAVKIGDTIDVRYQIEEIDIVRGRTMGAIEIHNQDGELVAVATHILKWFGDNGELGSG